MRTGVAPSNRKVSPPLEELNGMLVTLVLIELLRNEMMVAFPPTADGHEVVAVDLDGGVVRGGGAAEDEDVVAGAEDEQIGEPVLQPLRAERRRGHQREQEHPEPFAHGPSERQLRVVDGAWCRRSVCKLGNEASAAQAGARRVSRGPVRSPRTRSTACSTRSSSTASPSRTPPGLPGRLTISVRPRTPAVPRESAARGNRG